jgi:hypothetical protein
VRGSRLAGPALIAAFTAYGVALVVAAGPDSAPLQAAPPDAPASAAESGRTPLEDAAVATVAAQGLRPAADEDAVESEGRAGLLRLYGEYRPYFVRGDLNFDGRLDFAQAFVRRDGPEPLFDVAVFFGADGGFSAPVWVDRGVPLSTGDLSLDRSILVVTEDVDHDLSRRWRWDPAASRFVDVDEGEGEEDGEPWLGLDGRPRTTA